MIYLLIYFALPKTYAIKTKLDLIISMTWYVKLGIH